MISLLAGLALAGAAINPDLPIAANSADVRGLALLDARACELKAGAGLLPRAKAVAQLLARYPIVLDAAAFTGPQKPLALRVAEACRDQVCKPVDAYGALNLAAAEMLQARQAAGLRLVWAGKGAEPRDRQAQIAAFFDLSQDSYSLQCLAAPPAAPKPAPVQVAATPPAKPKSWLSQLRVASSVAETEKPDFNKRDPARLSFTDNAAGSGGVLSARAVVVAPALATWGQETAPALGFGDVRPFIGYERISARNRGNEVNNLDLGVRGRFRFAQAGGREAFVGGLTAAYETDDRLESSLTRFEGSLSVPMKTWVRRGWGGSGESDCLLCQTPSGALIAEYVEVGDPGAKRALRALPQYARLGFDADYDLRLRRGPDKSAYGVDLQYSRRQDVKGEGATADRLVTRATYYPAPASHYVFSLQYDYGQDLNSLAQVNRWMVTWGYRQ